MPMCNGWMAALREEQGLTLEEMGRRAKCPVRLLDLLETQAPPQGTTVPDMAKQIAKAYGMTAEQRRWITNERTAARHAEERKPTKKGYGR